jgi:3-methyladenine DNA glycosylase AlkD
MQSGVRHALTVSVDPDLVRAIRSGLRRIAEPERAPQMQAYMKSAMPYLGVRVPQVRALVRSAVADRRPVDADQLAGTVRALWDEATHREERYAAAALLGAPAVRDLYRPELIALCRHLIESGAWWDHVDEVSHRVGDLLLAFPVQVRPVVTAWQRVPEIWLRRASIICQLGHRERTDVELLAGAVEASADEAEFFLRKAIGWALRDYARTDPEWVRTFLATHALSPLSLREAAKHLDGKI